MMPVLRLLGIPMADAPLPRTWPEAAPYIVWGILVFSFGLEGVVKLLEGEFLISGIAFAAMLGIAALALWIPRWKMWAVALDARWVVASLLAALIALAAVPYIEQGRFPYAYLIGIGRAPPSLPVPPVEFPPTSLRLQFNAAGARPQQIEIKNVEWTWANPVNSELKPAPLDPTLCPPGSTTILTFGCSTLGRPPILEATREWIIFLVFLQPLPGPKEIKIDAHGASLPKWEMSALTERRVYMWFKGDLTRMIVDVAVVQKQ